MYCLNKQCTILGNHVLSNINGGKNKIWTVCTSEVLLIKSQLTKSVKFFRCLPLLGRFKVQNFDKIECAAFYPHKTTSDFYLHQYQI